MDQEQRMSVSRTRSDLEAGADVTIVAYGDSITAGYAVRRGFPSFWKQMLVEKYPEAGVEMINSGISG
ncbi:MAG: SGNH/GDSL hydrolase family protein, partial [Methanothrix sp.]